MDPKHTGELLKHLEKQNELLSESYSLISHELHQLQVEEEMLMRKFHQLMQAQALNKKNENIDQICNGDDRKREFVNREMDNSVRSF
ncbi:hypothetical protein like AT4G37608 [Hibiscus trionum]|uniref:Uncharacterized protein n=1 Tax=Hibiscus trionum TaxID=183268 RepID=A0A9W7MGP8_HIBTR|nr:hypothetical protein like AT4G37608 [Hibiscus trionum]